MSDGGMSDNQVFVNCPFDDDYRGLLRPLLFTLCYLSLTPRIASEFLNLADNRITKIWEVIKMTDYSIHDLSRCISKNADEYFRMNMPFEFGIDYGQIYFNKSGKKVLVLEGHRYDFQKTISDLSGVDVKCHNGEPEDVVKCIRDWSIEAGIFKNVDSATRIWYLFTDFTSDFYDERKTNGFTDKDLNDMPIPEYISAITLWLENYKATR